MKVVNRLLCKEDFDYMSTKGLLLSKPRNIIIILIINEHALTSGVSLPTVKMHSHIREARRCRVVDASARECKRVINCQSKRSEARWSRVATLVRLCNTFIVEPYTHKRGEARRQETRLCFFTRE